MKTCSYCGKEHPDTEVTCLIDGQPLVGGEILPPNPLEELVTPIAPVADPAKPPTDRRLRIIEVVLVCVIAVGSSILISFSSLFVGPYGSSSNYGSSSKGMFYWINAMLHEVAALGLLWYFLLRRGKSFTDLGLSWTKKDFGWSIPLCVGGSLIAYMVYGAIHFSSSIIDTRSVAINHVSDRLFKGGVSGMTMLFQFVNPFFEELIVRAYLMTEVRQLTGSAAKAIMLSAALQMSYHFYQGVPLALSDGAAFLLFSIYYAKTNRITPVILAHLYFDVFATLVYAARHG